jgi:hypothetical protein
MRKKKLFGELLFLDLTACGKQVKYQGSRHTCDFDIRYFDFKNYDDLTAFRLQFLFTNQGKLLKKKHALFCIFKALCDIGEKMILNQDNKINNKSFIFSYRIDSNVSKLIYCT